MAECDPFGRPFLPQVNFEGCPSHPEVLQVYDLREPELDSPRSLLILGRNQAMFFGLSKPQRS